MKNLLTLEQRVLNFIRGHHLILEPQRLVVAVSGGADSVCLLYVLFNLSEELGVSVYVAHLNHQLRGAEAEADAQYVAGIAEQLGLPAIVESRDVRAYQAQRRISLEEAAREVRYNFLAKVAKSVGAERVAVGHTLDDHVETILMHLIRGSGIRGLRGLLPLNKWVTAEDSLTVIRPLLEVSREETAAYCQRQRLDPRIDATNFSLSPLRNRIRQQLLPLLRNYNPQITEALVRTARIAVDNLAFLDEEASRAWDEIASMEAGAIVLDKNRFLQINPAIQRHLLMLAIEKLLGTLKDIEAFHIEEIMDALNKPAGKIITLPEGLTFSIEYNRYILGKDTATLSPLPPLEGEYRIEIPGETRLPGWFVEASISEPVQAPETENNFTACFDFDKVGNGLMARTRRPGDRFQPLGMSQPKKLNQFMIDAKIPQVWRQRVPIVVSDRHILWVVGWRIDERAKVTDKTRRVLCLKMVKQ